MTGSETFVCVALPTPLGVPSGKITAVSLRPTAADTRPWLDAREEEIRFTREGWFEVLVTVNLDTFNRNGVRFSHTWIPDHHPLHSEAIAADVFVAISDGKQLLRGNSIFGPGGAERLALELWQNSGTRVEVLEAFLQIRPLARSS